MGLMNRPEPLPVMKGYVRVPIREGGDWRLSDGMHRCRWKGCQKSAVAAIDRSRRKGRSLWWHYCGDHLFGRWVEDGAVYYWQPREETEIDRITRERDQALSALAVLTGPGSATQLTVAALARATVRIAELEAEVGRLKKPLDAPARPT